MSCYTHKMAIVSWPYNVDSVTSRHHVYSKAQGLNPRRGRSLGGKRTVDVNDEQTDGF